MAGSDWNALGEPVVPICALTEFRLRTPRSLLPTSLDYRRVVAQARATSGGDLLSSRFLIEDARTWVSLSDLEQRRRHPQLRHQCPAAPRRGQATVAPRRT